MSTTHFQKYDSNLFIEHVTRPNTYAMQRGHAHGAYEVYFQSDGDRYFFIHDRTIHLERGDLLIIPPYMIHRSLNGDEGYYERILVELHPDFFSGLITTHLRDQLLQTLDAKFQIYRLSNKSILSLNNIFHDYVINEKKGEDDLPTLIFLLELLRFIKELKGNRSNQVSIESDPLSRRMISVVQYINNRYTQDIGLDQVAEAFFISPEHLSRSFKQSTGFTFNEYLTNLRMLEAEKLLKSTRLSIAQIASSIGYQSHTHFGRVFRQKHGLTPSYYRKKVNP